ncbi:MAG: HEAT repeat domain-containing protein [Planctomycetaceae bacterium]|nr:HEAT repeat domain-containing protein [Planctomycetaceae bacterium]
MKDLRSGNNIERWSAASQLREAGSAAADLLPDLLSAIEDTDGCVREMVVGALGRIGKSSPEVRRALAIALRNDAYVPVRSEAAKVLGLLRANDSESIAALQKAKSDPSTSVRLSAEGSLKSLGH